MNASAHRAGAAAETVHASGGFQSSLAIPRQTARFTIGLPSRAYTVVLRPSYRFSEVGAGCGEGLCGEPAGGGDSMPSCRPPRRRIVRLPMGRGTQAHASGKGGTAMIAVVHDPSEIASSKDLTGRVTARDWQRVSNDLDAQGCAMIEGLLTPEECAAIAGLYQGDDMFRSRVVMGSHGFGRGEYKYFSYPLPDIVTGLRTSFYPHLVPIANRWNQAMGLDVRFPAAHADFIARCHVAGQRRPTPLLLQYMVGDYNCLHQDLYGEHVFPMQIAILLSKPGQDFTGGEFVLTEQRPRMQSRPEVVPLTQGDAVVFAVHHRPVQGTRGVYRVNVRHGVSRLRSGHRHTLGIIFHDAT